MADNGFIKPDPDAQATPPLDDEDLFEDAGDLEFYDKNLANTYETLYLARIPRYMWEAWQKLIERLDDDDEVQIGTLRTWNEPGETDDNGNVGPETTKLRMLLDPGCDEHHALPREYDLDVLDRDVRNHFIFTEEDLPSYKAKNKERQDQINAGIPAHILRQKEAAATAAASAAAGGVGPQRNTYDRKSRFQPYYRKAIPKKTKIFGKIHYDVRVEPRNTGEEERYLGQQLFQAENSKAKLQIISRNTASSIINPGTAGAVGWAGNFIKNTPSLVKPKKGENFKAARIPKNQLLDLIFDCFRQYQYWSMKALRQRTQQPDSYLRQVLEEVAVLNKSGPFANHYCLSEAYRDKAGNESREAAAAEAADDGDDDEPEEMEDVLYISSFASAGPAMLRVHRRALSNMHLVFDFDGTITLSDTIGHLARAGVAAQKLSRGANLEPAWDALLQAYLADNDAYRAQFDTPAARTTAAQELRFLSGLADVERASLRRVGEAALFKGLGPAAMRHIGADAVANGDVQLRPGLARLVARAREKGWPVSVVSVNWSSEFIRGVVGDVLRDDGDGDGDEVVSNSTREEDGAIRGPDVLEGALLVTAPDKTLAMQRLRGGGGGGPLVYFGDSTTDLACLMEADRGVVLAAAEGEGALLTTMKRLGLEVPSVEAKKKMGWARTFDEVLDSGFLSE
ncbi:hypothetical protein NHJ13051_000408 [Beauveria bassiana]